MFLFALKKDDENRSHLINCNNCLLDGNFLHHKSYGSLQKLKQENTSKSYILTAICLFTPCMIPSDCVGESTLKYANCFPNDITKSYFALIRLCQLLVVCHGASIVNLVSHGKQDDPRRVTVQRRSPTCGNKFVIKFSSQFNHSLLFRNRFILFK